MSTDSGAGRRDLPGTPIFDGDTSRRGLRMNKLFMSLRDAAQPRALPRRRGRATAASSD